MSMSRSSASGVRVAAVHEVQAHRVLPAQMRRDDQPAVWKHGDGMKIDFRLWRDGRDARRRAARRGHAIETLAPHREVNRAVVMPPALRQPSAARDAADREWRSAFRRHDAQV